jgi:hypothetical protein
MDIAKHLVIVEDLIWVMLLVIVEDLIRVMLEDLWQDYVGAYGN